MEHVRDDLSAYLDGALLPTRQSDVDAHLRTCEPCRSSLAELRTTARLIAALPAALPSRRLVPALAPKMSWLRPLRSFSAVATGAFVLLFMASATLDTGFRMGGGGTSPSSGRLIGGPTPAAAALEAAPRTDAAPAAAGTPRPQDIADARQNASPSAESPKAAGPQAPSAADQLSSGAPGRTEVYGTGPVRLGTPWLWLGLALLSAALALIAHRRLRAT